MFSVHKVTPGREQALKAETIPVRAVVQHRPLTITIQDRAWLQKVPQAVQVIRNQKPHQVITELIDQVQHITKVQAVEVHHEVTGLLLLQAPARIETVRVQVEVLTEVAEVQDR